MKKLLITILVWFALINLYAQKVGETTYRENIIVNVNTDFLITGEVLYYSIHCLEEDGKKSSRLSKVAYVELIGENEKPFLQAKIPLKEGRGAGDFFLPSTLPSGNYTLITYTKWLRNFPQEYFFQKQVTIINPYLKSPVAETQTTVNKNDVTVHSNHPSVQWKSDLVHLVIEKEKYAPRQKVSVVIKNDDPLHECKISLNVNHSSTKTETLSGDSKIGDPAEHLSPTEKRDIIFLPDLRGETIGGLVRESSSRQPVANTTIYMSAPDTSGLFQISTTDSAGRFYFVKKNIKTQNGIRFQIDRSSASVPAEIILDTEFLDDYRKFKPLPFSVSAALKNQIEQRNIYSQIENAYFVEKQDSVFHPTQNSFFGKADKIYKLDDFTRFPTMEDIFREYVFEVVVSKRDGKFELRLIDTNSKGTPRFLNAPLMLIDGIRIFDTEILMNYDPLLIKKISLVTQTYIYGGMKFDGILFVHTYEGKAKNLPVTYVHKEYTSWQSPKNYYSPIYNDKDNLARIPDFRVQLYWDPMITIPPGGRYAGEFYTSDVSGDFLIEAVGINSNGERVNLQQNIEVKK